MSFSPVPAYRNGPLQSGDAREFVDGSGTVAQSAMCYACTAMFIQRSSHFSLRPCCAVGIRILHYGVLAKPNAMLHAGTCSSDVHSRRIKRVRPLAKIG